MSEGGGGGRSPADKCPAGKILEPIMQMCMQIYTTTLNRYFNVCLHLLYLLPTHMYTYMCPCLHTYIRPTYLPTYLPILPTHPPTHPPTYIHTYIHLPTYPTLPTHIHTYIHTHTYLPTHPPTHPHTYIHLPTYLPIPTYIPTYLHTYTYIHTYCIGTYIHTYMQYIESIYRMAYSI